MGQLSNILKQIKNGDKEKFALVIDKFDPLIKKYTRILYKDESEDTRAELLLALWEASVNIEYIDYDGQIITYFSNAISNKFHELYRKSIKIHECEICSEDSAFSGSPFIEWTYCNINTEQDVQNFLKDYSGLKHQIYYLIMVESLSDSQIAIKLNISRQYANRQRKQLQKILQNQLFF